MLLGGCTEAEPEPEPGAPDAGSTATPAGCSALEVARADGSCERVGVPDGACAEGFEPDGRGGCAPILPAEPCPAGQLALPGEKACHEVMPCAPGRWGDVPAEEDTQFVDAAYAGGDSDGSSDRPWTSIQQGVDAALPGAIVAIAAGSYTEDVLVQGQAVVLWGRCPSLVEVVGTNQAFAAVDIQNGATGSAVRGLALRGASVGLGLSGSKKVEAQWLWIHDTSSTGIDIEDTIGPSSAAIRDVLVENATALGVFIISTPVELERVVVRDTRSDLKKLHGRGIAVEGLPPYQTRADVAVLRSLVERNREVGISANGSDLRIEATVVRETRAQESDGAFGRGVSMQQHTKASLTGCVVRANRELGVQLAKDSELTVHASVIADTEPNVATGRLGGGLTVQDSTALVRASLLEHNHYFGVGVTQGKATIEASIVRGTLAGEDGLLGDGIVASGASGHTEALLSAVRIESSARAGIANFGCAVTLGDSFFECNPIALNGQNTDLASYTFADLGGNRCGCGEQIEPCQVQNAELAAPEQL
ncbi:MAG: hypothetical protein HY744_03220 [Deltaproteobacteria bacterium]|nr:hypothetical protein [Deltaproteobacteria bacterium]